MLEKILKNQTGFTLSEIMTVIIIVGILASLALPSMYATMERVRAAEGVQILTAMLGAQKNYEFENGVFATNLADIDVEITTASYFDIATLDLDNNPNNVADIRRNNAYRLGIDEDGNITCANVAPNAYWCVEAGY